MCKSIVVGDGRHGYKENAPYDAIHVGAAADDVPHEVCAYDYMQGFIMGFVQ